MKQWLLLYLLLSSIQAVFSQADPRQKAAMQIDSIIRKIETEQNADKRFQLVTTIYGTQSEGFPSLMFELYKRLLLTSKRIKDQALESQAWSFAGQGYRLNGNYTKALECHHKAILLVENLNKPLILGYAQNQMAHIYKDREEYDKAINLYKSAALNIDKGENEFLSMWPQMNLGYVLMKTNQLDSSLYFSKRALELVRELHIEGYVDYILSNIGSAYSKQNNIELAIQNFRDAMATAEKAGSPRFLNSTYLAVAEHFFRHQQLDSSIYYAKKAIEAVQGSSMNNLVLIPSKMLTDIYEGSNADSTLKYLRVYRTANDSLYNTRANQQLQMMTFEEDMRQRNVAAEKVAYENKIKMNFMLVGIAFFFFIAIILYRNNLKRKKANMVLEKTLVQLKATQAQLVQSEKMASLGELTAGIAHEIQNPLNFVNNFSEVSNEMMDEMNAELEKGDIEEAKAISADIKQNLEKIHHHGKRADAIVKGMLQHSRKTEGEKEPTNINALTDEYLRLAYHGLRAKDNSFNAVLHTDYDEGIGNVTIIPQDIGRVILNLITNAFYAVAEKKKQSPGSYDPTVWVSTKKLVDKVEIKVADNGSGIPQNIINKIFQPFFTTKPTGQGTGLGLSLAYDIVKAHGGELKVKNDEANAAQFTIILPLK